MRERDNDSSMLAQFHKKFCSPKALAAYPYPHDNRLLPSQIVTLLLIHKQLCLLSGIVSCGYSVFKWSPAVEFKAPKFCPHRYCNFLHYGAVTSIKWWWSALTESQLPICIVLHLFWMVTLSRTIQVKLRIIFQVKDNPCLSPEINGSSIFEQVFVH